MLSVSSTSKIIVFIFYSNSLLKWLMCTNYRLKPEGFVPPLCSSSNHWESLGDSTLLSWEVIDIFWVFLVYLYRNYCSYYWGTDMGFWLVLYILNKNFPGKSVCCHVAPGMLFYLASKRTFQNGVLILLSFAPLRLTDFRINSFLTSPRVLGWLCCLWNCYMTTHY